MYPALRRYEPNRRVSALENENIITAPRGDRLRVPPHLYNTLEEMDELIEALP